MMNEQLQQMKKACGYAGLWIYENGRPRYYFTSLTILRVVLLIGLTCIGILV